MLLVSKPSLLGLTSSKLVIVSETFKEIEESERSKVVGDFIASIKGLPEHLRFQDKDILTFTEDPTNF